MRWSADGRAIRAWSGSARWKWPALAASFLVLLMPVFLPYAALFNAAFSRVASQFVWFGNFTLHNVDFVFFELSATPPPSRTHSCSAPLRPPSAPSSRW